MNSIPKISDSPLIDAMGAFVAVTVMLVYAFTVVAPYILAMFGVQYQPTSDMAEIIKSNKSTVDLITTAVVMFYFGASVGRRKDQDTVATLANTNAAAQAALAPLTTTVTETTTIVPAEPEDK